MPKFCIPEVSRICPQRSWRRLPVFAPWSCAPKRKNASYSSEILELSGGVLQACRITANCDATKAAVVIPNPNTFEFGRCTRRTGESSALRTLC